MRYIKKPLNPAKLRCLCSKYKRSLEQEKDEIDWQELHKDCKKKLVKNYLYPEQYQLCAYTEIGLEERGHHVEHIKPKSSYPEETFNYQNLILSCFREIERGKFSECFGGHYKGSQYDEKKFISPLDADCERYFSHTPDGYVKPHSSLSSIEKEKVSYTCDILNLNAPYLIERRKKLLREIILIIDELLENEEAFAHFAEMNLSIKINPDTMNEEINSFYSARVQQFGKLGRDIKKKNKL